MSRGEHGGDIWGAAEQQGVPLSRLLDFSANINPLGPSLKARKRLARDVSLVALYPDKRQAELRKLLAARDGVVEDCILFGNGATQLIHLIPRVGRYSRALVVEPAFSEYRRALSNSGSEIREFLLRPKDKLPSRSQPASSSPRSRTTKCSLLGQSQQSNRVGLSPSHAVGCLGFLRGTGYRPHRG